MRPRDNSVADDPDRIVKIAGEKRTLIAAQGRLKP
jgi:hypothetical protein